MPTRKYERRQTRHHRSGKATDATVVPHHNKPHSSPKVKWAGRARAARRNARKP